MTWDEYIVDVDSKARAVLLSVKWDCFGNDVVDLDLSVLRFGTSKVDVGQLAQLVIHLCTLEVKSIDGCGLLNECGLLDHDCSMKWASDVDAELDMDIYLGVFPVQ